MNELSDETIDRLAEAIVAKTNRNVEDCRFNGKEAEWVHTGAKYVPSQDLPLLGTLVKLMSKAEKEVGIWVIRVMILTGAGGVILAVLIKMKIIKL